MNTQMETCPCGSNLDYADCCEPLIKGEKDAPTAEALMRSRYSAHVKAEVDYIKESTHSSERQKTNPHATAAWCKKSEWQSLEILSTRDGGPEDQTGVVEFVACYRHKGNAVRYHEVAEFAREDGRWYFVNGETPKQEPVVQGPKIGRNDPCPCGSGKKFKKCCAA
jgi:SEC-C motif domain protein